MRIRGGMSAIVGAVDPLLEIMSVGGSGSVHGIVALGTRSDVIHRGPRIEGSLLVSWDRWEGLEGEALIAKEYLDRSIRNVHFPEVEISFHDYLISE